MSVLSRFSAALRDIGRKPPPMRYGYWDSLVGELIWDDARKRYVATDQDQIRKAVAISAETCPELARVIAESYLEGAAP